VLIVANVSIAMTMLLVSMYITEPLQFSSFPSILLLATLFRLGLNISASRLILLHGHAGDVIASFGNFVVGGNYVVGVVIFLILNSLAGIVLGVIQLGIPLGQTLGQSTLLTVRAGLLSQIPAILISTATGIIVTRAASDGNLGRDIATQVLANPRALFMT